MLAGIDLCVSMSDWCDAVWAIIAEAPGDNLKQLLDNVVTAEAIADPERARATWGLLPEHQAGASAAEQSQVAGQLPAPAPEVPERALPKLPSGRG